MGVGDCGELEEKSGLVGVGELGDDKFMEELEEE